MAKEWKDALGGLGCEGIYELSTPSHETIWLVASTFSGVSLVEMGKNAGFEDLTEFITTGTSIDQVRDKDSVLERLLAGTPQSTQNLRNEVAAHGARLCPVLSYVISAGYQETGRLQITERDYWQPHSELAQSVLVLRGCAELGVDGFFGPSSRSVWNTTGLPLTAGVLPTPGDTVRLAASPQACGFTGSLVETVAVMGQCRQGRGGPVHSARLGAELGALVLASSGQPLQRVQRVFDHCEPQYAWNLGLTAEAIAAMTEGLQFPSDKYADLAAVADQIIDLMKVDEPWHEADARDLFGGAGRLLWERHGVSTLGRFGLLLLEKSGLPAGNGLMDNLRTSTLSADEIAYFLSAYAGSTLQLQNQMITSRPWDESGHDRLRTAGFLKLDVFLPLEEVHYFLQFAGEMEASALLQQEALRGEYPQLNYAFAALVLEGFTPDGRNDELARRHLRAAAQNGHAPSQLRLAMMLKYGQGGDRDPEGAQTLLRQAAQGEEPSAQLLLAEGFEQGDPDAVAWAQAETLYRDAINALPPETAADVIRTKLIAGGPFWQTDGPGQRLLEDWALAAVARADDTEEMTERRRNWRVFAGRMGDHFADTKSGMLLDLARAAQWWRLAGTDGSWKYAPVQDKLLALLLT
ncbi:MULTISPECIES: tetratricopeptide repeat protein [Roseobacteraceae]|uniref:Sel1 repeat protein n=1 Tax=Pseudosulfitobacter pseudonitzschiae TaxID=1402135 RepID=A0A221K6K1_9RHOB|nr:MULTISPECIES: tetratricopeptide repeat protein [Roseobacteraceae]ASM74493.1 hypothetical protein SULPSESMR1_04797 [Pseudosulfitobacter pseudonitzschiae]